jgi:hypothetical protein
MTYCSGGPLAICAGDLPELVYERSARAGWQNWDHGVVAGGEVM